MDRLGFQFRLGPCALSKSVAVWRWTAPLRYRWYAYWQHPVVLGLLGCIQHTNDGDDISTRLVTDCALLARRADQFPCPFDCFVLWTGALHVCVCRVLHVSHVVARCTCIPNAVFHDYCVAFCSTSVRIVNQNLWQVILSICFQSAEHWHVPY